MEGFIPELRAGKTSGCRAALILLLLLPMDTVSGAVLESIVKKWTQYKQECLTRLEQERTLLTGVFCNGTFDNFVCWPFSYPGNVSVPCPWYLPKIQEGSGGHTHRYCTGLGVWRTRENSSDIWRDNRECNSSDHFQQNNKAHALLLLLRVCYTVGYSVSLGALILALGILLTFRKLHCTRNSIHMNLFGSFIMRALAVLIKDMQDTDLTPKMARNEDDWLSVLKPQIPTSCRIVHISLHFFVGANSFWLLVEGIYLHTTIVSLVLCERRMLLRYLAIGWVCPLLFIIPWVIARTYLENEGCWGVNQNTAIWYIIKGPMLLCTLINFIVHIKILRLLHLKLKAQQLKFTDYKYRFAKATLILIPLLGTHEVLFTFVSDEHIKGLTKHVLLFIQLTMSSFQGFVVAYLYCFTNGEVKAELRKQWNLFLLQYFPCKSCFLRNKVKYKTQSAKKPKSKLFPDKGSYQNGKKNRGVQLLQATVNISSDLSPHSASSLQYFARGSVSESSDGGLTLGETIEETVEESEI
ncbi:glucagon-like peptide 2 receptor [Engystomops pustulosus]|uniref:glucagon-like peptide 2 receptor n=1 Tax=Engystomops pustulosus TaxID=76066 RepID=UPI003AFB0407